MTTLQDIRAKYPQYENVPDDVLADRLHAKFYSDMPKGKFNAKIGYKPAAHGNVPEFRPVGVEGYDPVTGDMPDRPQREPSGFADDRIDDARAFTLGAVDGVPIAGPALSAITRGGAAALVTPFSDKSFSENYDHMGRIQQRTEHENPIATTAGNVTGTVMGTLPAMAAAPAAFGIGPGNLMLRSGLSALTGGGIGVTDAAVRSGGDPEAIGKGGLEGFAAGAAGPAVGQVVGAGYRAVAQWLADRGIRSATGLAPEAVKRIAEKAQADGLDEAIVRQRLADLGDEGRLADLGPNLRQEAARLVTDPGPARATVTEMVKGRDAAANRRILDALDGNLGKAPIPSRVDASIRANQRALSPEYEAVLKDAKRVETQPIADALDSMLVDLRGGTQAAVKNVRGMLNVTGTDVLDPNPRVLLETRHEIDGLLEDATGNMARVLRGIRQDVDDTLASSAPGIKDVDAKFAEFARQRKALERGQDVLQTGKTAIRPQELADEAAEAALPQGTLIGPSGAALRLRDGARADIDRIVGTNANDRARLAKLIGGEGDWNRAKLSTLFGEEKADRILKVLDAEKTFAETSHAVVGNSETAARTAAREANRAPQGFGTREGYIAGGPTAVARATGMKLVDALFKRGQQASKSHLDAAIALGLTKPGPVNARLVEALFQNRKKAPEALSRVAQALMLSSSVGGSR